MGCLSPIHINNKSKSFTYHGGFHLGLEVPCGQCSECKKAMQDEYSFRGYYQALDTIKNGGYIYFDTLTYDRQNLPHMSDFEPELKGSLMDYPCFNLDHYRLFFKRLRRELQYLGFNPAHNLKYFLCSEYGTDESKSHRPHYHVLFYITDPNLDSLVLSAAVAKCWKYGRTDGIPYQSDVYVKNHTFGENGDKQHMINVCNYVAKYVTKNSEFEEALNWRLKAICERLNIKDDKEYVRKIKRNLAQFHRQSQGFGIYGLQYNDIDEMFKTGMISMEDSSHVIKHISMPMYFQRKLFYDLTKDYRGEKKWQLNEKGIAYKLSRLDDSIEMTAQKFEEWYKNINGMIRAGDINISIPHGLLLKVKHDRVSAYNENLRIKDLVDTYLDGRTWKDFAEYILAYKGRLKTEEQINREQNGIFYVEEKHDFYTMAHAQDVDDSFTLFNYTDKESRARFGQAFYSTVEIESDDDYIKASLDGDILPKEDVLGCCVNQYSDPKFHYFDGLYNVYIKYLYYDHTRKDKLFNKKEGLRNIYKIYGKCI